MDNSPNIRRRARPSAGKPIGSAAEAGTETYAVGYGRPPVDTRFGGSRGNRSGRKKGSRSREAILREELDAKILVPGHGRMSKFQLGIRQLANQAAKGELKAILPMIKLAMEYERAAAATAGAAVETGRVIEGEPASMDADQPTPAGLAILAMFEEEIRADERSKAGDLGLEGETR